MDPRFTGLLRARCILNLSHSTEKLNQIEKGERSLAKVSLRGEPVGIEGEADDFVCGYFVSFDKTQLSEHSSLASCPRVSRRNFFPSILSCMRNFGLVPLTRKIFPGRRNTKWSTRQCGGSRFHHRCLADFVDSEF